MTATEHTRTRPPYDSGDPVAVYDATAETKNYLVGRIMRVFPRTEAVQRVIEVRRQFRRIDVSSLDPIRAACEEYRRQIAELDER